MCNKPVSVSNEDADFFKQQNAVHQGDYIATYPLENLDSCLIRIKTEVPQNLQAFACLSLWYHLPRQSPERCFRWLELYEQHYPHDTVAAFAQLMRGEFMVEMEKLDSARIYLEDARQRYSMLKRPLDIADTDHLLARCFLQERRHTEALDIYFSVMQQLNAIDTTFSSRYADLYLDIAVVYRQEKDIVNELYWLKKAWMADHTHLDSPWQYKARTASRMASAYARIKPDSSLVMAQLAVDIYRANGSGAVPAPLLYYLGLAHFKNNHCEKALPLQMAAYRSGELSHAPSWVCQFAQAIGESYFCLGQLDSAEWYTVKALETTDTINLIGARKRLSEIYARRGNHSKALEQLTIAYQLNQRAYATERADALAVFEKKFEARQKQHQIELLEAQNQRHKLQKTTIALGLTLALCVALLVLIRQRTKQQLLKKEKQLAESRSIMHLQALNLSQQKLSDKEQALEHATQIIELKNHLIAELEMQAFAKSLANDEDDATTSVHFPKIKILTRQDWEHFQHIFDTRMPGYSRRLRADYPNLTNAEIRLFLLIKLEFSSVEIADILGISIQSVWRSRNRLRNKLSLDESVDLECFIRSY